MKTLYILLPCYNEQDNLITLISNWYKQKSSIYEKGYDFKIIIIDDKSTDDTKAVIEAQKNLYKEIIPLYHAENKGLGGGILSGLNLFASTSTNNNDIVIVMDADNTHDPKYANSMIEKIESGADCVIASRYCNSSKVIGLANYRHILSTCAKYYYQTVLRIPNVRDYTCAYRAYNSGIIQKAFLIYKDKLIEEKSFACMMELLYKLHVINANITEVPFGLRYDFKQGDSKMKVTETIIASILTSMKLKFSIGSKWKIDGMKTYETTK